MATSPDRFGGRRPKDQLSGILHRYHCHGDSYALGSDSGRDANTRHRVGAIFSSVECGADARLRNTVIVFLP